MAAAEVAVPQAIHDMPTDVKVGGSQADLVNGGQHDTPEEGSNGLEQSMSGLSVTPENELHRACAAGKLDDVRGILSKSLEGLETLDMTTGCTPIVLAIRQNHVEVVRELLSAGAIVPPPGVTNDPVMLSTLYPPQGHMYSMPPFMGASSPPDFYAQPFFPPHGRPSFGRKESPPGQIGNGVGNLPPADVSKSIPCRNFPNCKYGPSCVFFHPSPQHGFYPAPPPNGYMSNGYDYQFQSPPLPPIPASFYGQGPPPVFMPASQHDQSQDNNNNNNNAASSNTLSQNDTQHSSVPASENPASQSQSQDNVTPPPHTMPNGMQPHMAPFVPSFPHPASPPTFGASPLSPPPQAFAMPPMSPSQSMSASMPSLPPQDQFFATSPPANHLQFGPNGHMRRQSFNQPLGGFQGKPFGHSKKLSFSGINGAPRPFGARPSAPPGSLGTWKDGNPPPCAFFSQGKCRNGEMCKFPHLDAEGNDCRHPDIIRGIIPPLPSLSKQGRPMRMGGFPQNFGPYDPNFRQQQHQAFMAGRPSVPVLPSEEIPAENAESSLDTSSAPTRTTSNDTSAAEMSSSMSSLTVPPKPDTVEDASGPTPTIGRSASQPGQPRASHPGQSRSHSPAPSNVSFHGNGHPRRGAGLRAPFNPHSHSNGFPGKPNRSVSAEAKVTQRVPQAHEFPALGGQGATNPTSPQGAPAKTAAQVLSAPAPFRPVAPPKPSEEEAVTVEAEVGEENGLTMDSESESDVVVITSHPPKSAPSAPSPTKRPGVSFASIAGTSAPPADAAVKA